MAADASPPPRWPEPIIAAYAAAHTVAPDDLQQRLSAETAERLGRRAQMQTGHPNAAFMGILLQLMGARRVIEVGTFTGYSSLAMARALPSDGYLLCCDVSEEWTAIARRYWAEAGVAGKVELRIGPALDTLRALPEQASFDAAYIDADKDHYLDYFEELLPRLRPGGVVMVDNTIWGGDVANPDSEEPSTAAIRAFNDAVAADPRVTCVLLTVGDGLTLLRKN
jgi:caffeoyl-CoA O-methyltransferase